jgi:predicted metal-dependent phosphoesterase TrpH
MLADLHVHTALSPCGDDEMSPPAIVDAALAAGLDMIAVCDHNAAGNAAAVGEAAGSRLTVISGIEITTAEEVHVVGPLPHRRAAANAADEVRETLPVADDDYTASSASSTS